MNLRRNPFVRVFSSLKLTVICLTLLFILTVAVTRMVALGSVLAAATLPPAAWFVDGHPSLVVLALLLAVLVIARHRGNLTRMRSGREERLGEREKR